MDEQVHHEWAQQIASGRGLGSQPFFRAPLYYYLLGGVYAVCGSQIALARFLGCVLGAGTCYLVARLGMRLGGFALGLLAGLLAAVYWPLVYFDNQLLSVGLEVFLNVLLLLLLIRAVQRGSLMMFLAAGVVWGLSVLARPNVLALAPGILLWLWIGARLAQRQYRKLPAAVLVCAGAAAIVLPVTLRNRMVGGEWVLLASNAGVNFFIGNNAESNGWTAIVPGTRPDWQGGYEDTHRIAQAELGRTPTEGEVSQYWAGRATDWIRANPADWAALMVHKLRLFWSPIEISNNQPIWFFARRSGVSALFFIGFPVAACAGAAGLVLLRRDWRIWSLPCLYLLLYMGTVVLFFCPGRYRLPAVPVLLLLTAAGVQWAWRSVRERRVGALCAYGLAGGLMAAFLATNPPARAEYRRESEGLGHMNLANYCTGLAEQDTRHWRSALDHLKKAVQLRPADLRARLALADAYLRTDQPDAARDLLTPAVADWPDNVECRLRYGYSLERLGQLDEAAETYRRISGRRPEHADAELHLGTVLGRQGRAGEAITHLRRAIALQPELVSARLNLATALGRLGRTAEAVTALEEARDVARRTGQGGWISQIEGRLQRLHDSGD